MNDKRIFTEDVVENKPDWVKEQVLPRIRRKTRAAKYGSRRTDDAFFPALAGRSFQSKLERDRARELCLLLKAGEIRKLEFQPRVFLSRANISYHADFRYMEKGNGTWKCVYEDTKGITTERFRIIKKPWAAYGPKIRTDDRSRGARRPLRITVRAFGQIRTKNEIWPS